jgi:hypothetical protein
VKINFVLSVLELMVFRMFASKLWHSSHLQILTTPSVIRCTMFSFVINERWAENSIKGMKESPKGREIFFFFLTGHLTVGFIRVYELWWKFLALHEKNDSPSLKRH